MIWEQKSVIIVMLTNIVESGVLKCYQYWPERVGDTIVYRNLIVKTVEVEVTEDYTVSSFEITNTLVRVNKSILRLRFP